MKRGFYFLSLVVLVVAALNVIGWFIPAVTSPNYHLEYGAGVAMGMWIVSGHVAAYKPFHAPRWASGNPQARTQR